jgi:tetratricopeptide (TPR) repeat protein
MFPRHWSARSFCWLAIVAFATPVFAANDGQDDLDKATQLKVAAETPDDLAAVIDKLDSALEKGLDEENSEFAEQMLISTLMQRGSTFSNAVFNIPAQDPQRGMRLMQLRSWALTDLQRALELDSKLTEAHLLIGKLQSLPLGDNSAAKRALTKVIKTEDATPEQKAEAYALRSAVQSDETKQVEDLNSAVEQLPKKPEYLRVRGQYLYSKQKYDEALADIDKAIKLKAEHAATQELRGMILLGLEKYDEALESFNKASDLEPTAALPYQHRGELYRQKGDLEKAAEQLTKALELSPDNVATLLVRSAVLFELKKTDEALADVERAIKVAPNIAQPYLMRAEILAASGQLGEAIFQLDELLQKAPGNVQLLNRLGNFYILAGRPRKTIETLTLVVNQEPDNFNALRFRADAYLSIGKHAEAIADFDKALAINGDDESLLNNFAWVLATSPDDEVRNGKRAIELATKASELTGHQTPHVLSTLGAAYAETGDFESAKKWSQQAVDLAKKELEVAANANDEERARMKKVVQDLEKERANYEEGKPVRERQETEEATQTDEQQPKVESEPAAEEPATPAKTPEVQDSTADS